jgi:hypothetical protein
MVCRGLMFLHHEHSGRNATDHELLVSLNADRRLRNRLDPVNGPQPHHKVANRLLLSLQMSAQSARFVEAHPASQTQLDSMRSHLISQRMLDHAATNTNPLGF